MLKKIFHGIYLAILIFFLNFFLEINALSNDIKNTEDLIPAFENLLTFTKSDETQLNNVLLEKVLDFVASPKDIGKTFPLGQRNGGSSDYFEFTIDRSLNEVLGVSFNTDIPSYITAPSTVRRSFWIEPNRGKRTLELDHDIMESSKPGVVRGIEFVENTPDRNSGAYYSYELDRAIFYTKHHGNRALISMSEQRKTSSIGKKALILGSDDDWNYLYSGYKGCTIPGLGWISSYMYNSSGIVVYYETNDPYPQVRYSIFKWINAGWSSLNFTKSTYLRKGAERYAKAFKEIIESQAAQDIDRFSKPFKQIKNLPIEGLRKRAGLYFEELKRCHYNDNNLCKKWFDELFRDDHYIKSLSRDELEAISNKEYLKYTLGKQSTFTHIHED